MKLDDFKPFKAELLVDWEKEVKGYLNERLQTKFKDKAMLLTPDEIQKLGHAFSIHITGEHFSNLITSSVYSAKGDSRAQANT